MPSDVVLRNASYTLVLSGNQGYAVKSFAQNGKANVIDIYDDGRLGGNCSVYGSSNYGTWNGRPFQANCVQGGNWTNASDPTILGQKLLSASEHAASIRPVVWTTGEPGIGFRFDQNISLQGAVMLHKQRVRWDGTGFLATLGPQAARHQERSAWFLKRRYSTYRTGGGVANQVARLETSGNTYSTVMNGWCAMTDTTGYGIWYRTAMPQVTHYTVGETPTTKGSCSYIAHLDTSALVPGYDKAVETQAVIGSRKQAETAFGRALV
jgi:hypothetical protein